ncbi:MAG: hypothetical protein IT463_05770 [Planctomycetes bacterium]|nr:hypothetical protein [Planctomycetota bacterium]
MAGLLLATAGLLAGCYAAQEQPLPDEVSDPKLDLVAHIRDNPQDLDAHADLLRLQIRAGDAEGAKGTVAHARKYNPQDFRALLLQAQYDRWQTDLLGAEKSLLAARDLAPDRLEPRVALAGLYNQTYLEGAELEQRRVALELCDAALRPEFALDYAFALAQMGRDGDARKAAEALVAGSARAHLLLAELALLAGTDAGAVEHTLAAVALEPAEPGNLQFAARLVCAVEDPAGLKPVFDGALAGQDRAEVRWTALFGLWMLAVRKAPAQALSGDADQWRQRLATMDPAHPDLLGRWWQLLKLDPARKAEAEAAGKVLQESSVGMPPEAPTMDALLDLWRAEDLLRLGAGRPCFEAVSQLEVRAPGIAGLRMLRVMALFKARDDTRCLAALDAWLGESEEPDEVLQTLRWWLLLRNSRGPEVLKDLESRQDAPGNARLWVEAVAKFHTYRGKS